MSALPRAPLQANCHSSGDDAAVVHTTVAAVAAAEAAAPAAVVAEQAVTGCLLQSASLKRALSFILLPSSTVV